MEAWKQLEPVGREHRGVVSLMRRRPDRLDPDQAAVNIRPSAPVIWERQVELVGWVLPSAITVGTPVEMTLVYRTLRPLDRDWRIFAHFDSRVMRVNGDHEPAIGWCPTSQWRAGDVIADRVAVQFEQPGRYSLTIGFFTGSAPHWENMPLSSAPAAMKSKTPGGVRLAEIVVD